MLRTIIPYYPPPSPALPRKRGRDKGGLSEPAVPAGKGMRVVLRPMTEAAGNQALLPSPTGRGAWGEGIPDKQVRNISIQLFSIE
ncbi:MAG TPA: hypothetical protein ENJ86_11960 [Methylothermaceae bacterium]|nr:hypothetical protein [Methylothermaceae bacterium]